MKLPDVLTQHLSTRSPYMVKKFLKDEHGGMTPFVIVSFLTMVLVSGMAVDFMRHEMARADLQNALDRGVLAAADVDQNNAESEAEARTLVLEYMKSRSYKAPILNINVTSPEIAGGRRVTATANYELDTFFLKLMGLNQMSVPAGSQAQDNASSVEISMILDVSDSMSSGSSTTTGTRLTDLKDAAKKFVDDVLTDDNRDRTAISIIPYSAQVNLPDNMASAYNISTHHDYGNCVDFSATDYSSAAIDTSVSLTQSQHFVDYWESQWYWKRDILYYQRYWYYGWRYRPVYGNYYREYTYTPVNHLCPKATNEILPYSNDNTKLKTAIDNLDYEGWTASYTGMKWGVAMLDPTARPLVTSLIGKGQVADTFAGWPADWSDPNTQKVIILMTDGRNTRQYRFKDDKYDTQTTAYWNDNVAPDGFLEYNVNNQSDGKGDTYLKAICDAAKQHSNTIVFTVAFELDDTTDGLAASAALNDCATSTATEYDANGHNIDTAFLNIAASIQKLRLTQ